MSCMQKLYWTYENILEQCVTDDAEPLTPVGHTIQNAHIIIVIDGQGNFQTARVMPPKTAILLPATESSENRTSGEAPHPLADKIQYVAKDYVDYGGEKKAYFDGYLKQLKAWCESPFAHPKVQAVLNYVAKGRVVADLVEAGIFQLGSGNKVLNKWEAEGDAPSIFSALPKTKGEIEFGSALVCWQVEIAGDVHSQTWTDKTIQQSWADYAASEKAEKGFCLVQGEEAVISTMHPAKLRHTGDKAKLISSNDTGGYTFRGRFATAEEAASVSADVSAKAHSALRWLISRQGIRNGDQVTVSWAISGKPVPSPMKDISSEIDWDNLDISAVGNPDEIAKQTSSENSEPSPDWSANIGRAAAQIIKKKLHGYQAELKAHEQISLIMLDSATPGRMALTYYQEFLPVIAGGTSMPIPDDLVHQSFQAACNPNRCENWEWQRNIGVACALYKGWRARHHDLSQRRIYPMSLDTQNRSRDYLYGRLLAVAENTESYALYLAGEKRATTAERYMQRFAEHPFATWRNIELALKPYQERLRNNGKDTGAQAIGEIMELFAIDDFTCDDKLSGEFLLGYHCQKMEIARRITELSANKSKIHE